MSQVVLDLRSSGAVDFQGPNLDGQAFTYAQPGIYTPTVRVTDPAGGVHTATTLVHVYDQAALDARLQLTWQGLKGALRAGDVSRALPFIHSERRAAYDAQFRAFSPSALAGIDQHLTTIRLVEVGFGGAQYEMLRTRGAETLSFAVWFQLDLDGVWRIRRL